MRALGLFPVLAMVSACADELPRQKQIPDKFLGIYVEKAGLNCKQVDHRRWMLVQSDRVVLGETTYKLSTARSAAQRLELDYVDGQDDIAKAPRHLEFDHDGTTLNGKWHRCSWEINR